MRKFFSFCLSFFILLTPIYLAAEPHIIDTSVFRKPYISDLIVKKQPIHFQTVNSGPDSAQYIVKVFSAWFENVLSYLNEQKNRIWPLCWTLSVLERTNTIIYKLQKIRTLPSISTIQTPGLTVLEEQWVALIQPL